MQIIGVPEHEEGRDMVKFLDELFPSLLDITGRKLELERAHRVPAQRSGEGDKPRPILARFLIKISCCSRRGAKESSLGRITIIFLFPDFANSTREKRDQFKECKKVLHQRKITFALMFPARLRINTKDGSKVFTCPNQAMSFIESMGE